jgi:hypothetical protein
MLTSLLSKAAGLAAEAARTSLQIAGAVAEAASNRIRGRRSDPVPEPPRSPAGQPPPARSAPRARAARPAPPPPAPAAPAPAVDEDPPPIAVVREPTRGEAARIRARQREAEQTPDSPGPEIRIDEPWPGYKAMKAPDIVERLAVADDAVKAVVLLYERSHRGRKTVLQAAEL